MNKQVVFRVLSLYVILIIASGIGFAFRYFNLPETNVAIVYLLAVLLSALLFPGYVYGCFMSVLSAFAFNYLFTEPYFTFSANAPSYVITFIIMTITSMVVSTLTSRLKLSKRRSQEREAEAKALYSLTNHLTDALELQDIAAIAANTVSSIICEGSGCLCFDEKGLPEETFIQQISSTEQIRRKVVRPEALIRKLKSLHTCFCIDDEFSDWPIYARETVFGTIRLPAKKAATLSKSQIRLLHSMIESIALAMDRFHSSRQRQRLKEETELERYRNNLLRSISHDLRTPLSGILGSTEMLLDMTGSEDCRYLLINGIAQDAGWLYSLVENILNLTRLQDRNLMINRQPEAVEEILGSAVSQISRRYPLYDIGIYAPDQLFWIPMDARLIIQVLINLLDNAVKNTIPPGEINITVTEDKSQNQAVFIITDNGCGITQEDLPHIFQMFYTAQASHTDARPGIGLGLAICDAIIKAHGGTIQAQNRIDCSGAEFIFTLPLEEKSNE